MGFWVSYTNIDPWEEIKAPHAVCADTQSPSVADDTPGVCCAVLSWTEHLVKHAFLWHFFGTQQASFCVSLRSSGVHTEL